MAPANPPAGLQMIPAAVPPMYPAMRAGDSTQESFVLFLNTTQRSVHLYWIDHQGRQTIQLTLGPRASAKVNTYRSHPWIFRDNCTGERMQVAHQNSFWPEPYFMRNPQNLDQWIPCRKQISIHFPVRSLRETLLWRVAASMRGCWEHEGMQRIEQLHLPQTLKTDLKTVLRSIENHRIGRPTADS